ncbi:MAG TPA: VWA domain-containing protein [Terriglobia bacterium]|nr:VWA domain-containing protein [Terriglobia bacterium]
MQNSSFKSQLFGLLIFCGVALFSLVTFSSPALQGQESKPPATASATQANKPEFKLRLERNVVVVRVVVRDKKGRAVSGLRKEDFRIRDNEKPQVISGFSVETPEAAGLPARPSAAAPAAKAEREAVTSPETPLSYVAFYFDDLYSSMSSIVRSRKAAEKFIAGLPLSDRVAIFTSSGAQTLDFTDDRQKLHEALMKLRVNTHVNPTKRCPEISDYLARQLVDYGDSGALAVVIDEAVNVCHWSRSMASNTKLIREQAQEAYDAYRYQALAVLKNLEAVIDRMAVLPGERQVMVVSDGFINLGRGNRVESLVDRALHARVTVSVLDGKGVALNMADLNAKRSYAPPGDLGVQADMYNSSREVDATGTLAEIANGTGGQFFYGDNNLLGGMRKILLPPEVSYVLTFSPSDLKADGALHALKVTLAHGHGLTVQARKGYFAPQGQARPEELASNDIREAIYSPYPIQGLPLAVQTETRKDEAQNEEIAIQAQLDIRTLPFEKKGDHSVDDVVFAVGLFDHDRKYITGRQFTYALALKDANRAEMEKSGLSLKTNLSAKVGAYTLRVVVRDSQGGRMAALSKAVEVPPQTVAAVAKQIATSEQPLASSAQGEKTVTESKAAEPPPQTVAPAAKQAFPPEQKVASNTQGGKTEPSGKTVEVPSPNYPPMATLDVAPGQVDAGDKPYFQAYRRAKPITEWPLKKLRHHIPELNGITPAADQSRLPEILRGVSANLQRFVVNFVDTTAVENIDEAETPPYWGGLEPYPSLQSTKHIRQKFDYLILRHQQGGAFNLVEYRTDLHGQKERRQKQSTEFIKTAGFAAMPLFFGSLQQPWSEFRYLGRQSIADIDTEVVVFAEHVDPEAVMGHFVLGGISVPLLVQGVAWIRHGDDQILQMRTDLLASLPPLTRMMALVHFAGFQIQGSPAALWLPKEVEVGVEFGGYVFSNRHTYSDYRMFRANSVIKAGGPEAQQH